VPGVRVGEEPGRRIPHWRAGAEGEHRPLVGAVPVPEIRRRVPWFHRRQADLRYSDRIIYSPSVPVFRADDGALLDEPYAVSFLTAAAPNLGAIVTSQPEAAASVPGVLAARAGRVLAVAAAHGHRQLVLGAWGCGVLRNDPAIVAAAFAAQLARAQGHIDHVVFAVLYYQRGAPTPRHLRPGHPSSGRVTNDDATRVGQNLGGVLGHDPAAIGAAPGKRLGPHWGGCRHGTLCTWVAWLGDSETAQLLLAGLHPEASRLAGSPRCLRQQRMGQKPADRGDHAYPAG
jgi:hypothetical protein